MILENNLFELTFFSHSTIANEIEEERKKDWEAIIHSFLATSKYDPDDELGIEFQEKRLKRSQHHHHHHHHHGGGHEDDDGEGNEEDEGDEESDEEFGVYTEQILDCPF